MIKNKQVKVIDLDRVMLTITYLMLGFLTAEIWLTNKVSILTLKVMATGFFVLFVMILVKSYNVTREGKKI